MAGFDDFLLAQKLRMAAQQAAPPAPTPQPGNLFADALARYTGVMKMAPFAGFSSGASAGPPLPPPVDPALVAALYQTTQYNKGNVYPTQPPVPTWEQMAQAQPPVANPPAPGPQIADLHPAINAQAVSPGLNFAPSLNPQQPGQPVIPDLNGMTVARAQAMGLTDDQVRALVQAAIQRGQPVPPDFPMADYVNQQIDLNRSNAAVDTAHVATQATIDTTQPPMTPGDVAGTVVSTALNKPSELVHTAGGELVVKVIQSGLDPAWNNDPAGAQRVLAAYQQGGGRAAWNEAEGQTAATLDPISKIINEASLELIADPWNWVGPIDAVGARLVERGAEVAADAKNVATAAQAIRDLAAGGDAAPVVTEVGKIAQSPRVADDAKQAAQAVVDHLNQGVTPPPEIVRQAADRLTTEAQAITQRGRAVTTLGTALSAPQTGLHHIAQEMTEPAVRQMARSAAGALEQIPGVGRLAAKVPEAMGTLSRASGMRRALADTGMAATSLGEATLRHEGQTGELVPSALSDLVGDFKPTKDGMIGLGKDLKIESKVEGNENISRLLTRSKGVWSVAQEFRGALGDATVERQAREAALAEQANRAAAKVKPPKMPAGTAVTATGEVAPQAVQDTLKLLPKAAAAKVRRAISDGIQVEVRSGRNDIALIDAATGDLIHNVAITGRNAMTARDANLLMDRMAEAINHPDIPRPQPLAPTPRGSGVNPFPGPAAPLAELPSPTWAQDSMKIVSGSMIDDASGTRAFDLTKYIPAMPRGFDFGGTNLLRPLTRGSQAIDLAQIGDHLIAAKPKGDAAALRAALNGTGIRAPIEMVSVPMPDGSMKYLVTKGVEDVLAAMHNGERTIDANIRVVDPQANADRLQTLVDAVTQSAPLREGAIPPTRAYQTVQDAARPVSEQPSRQRLAPDPTQQALSPATTTYVPDDPARAKQVEADLAQVAPDGMGGYQSAGPLGVPVRRVNIWKTDLALSEQQQRIMSQVFRKGSYAGRQYGDVATDLVHQAKQILEDGWSLGTADNVPADLAGGDVKVKSVFDKMIASGRPATEEGANRAIAQAAASLLTNAMGEDLGYNIARKQAGQLAQILRPITERLGMLPRMARESMLYNPASGSFIAQNALGNTLLALMGGDVGAATRSLDPELVKSTHEQIKKGAEALVDDAYSQLLDRLELPHSPDVFQPHAKDAMSGTGIQTTWEKFFSSSAQRKARAAGEAASPLEKMTWAFANPGVKNWAITMDTVFRKGTHMSALERLLPDARTQLLAGVDRGVADVIEQVMPAGQEVGGEALRGALRRSGVDALTAQGVGKQWATLLDAANQQGIAHVNDLMFSMDELNADSFLNKIFTFHWWASRASLFYARAFVEHPGFYNGYQHMAQALSDYADGQPDMPPRFRNFLKLWNTPLGFTLMANPVAFAATWLTFHQDPTNDAATKTWIDSLVHDSFPFKYFMLNPIIDSALNLFGAYGDTFSPDPLATWTLRNQVGAALNFISDKAGGPMLGTPYDDAWEYVRQAISGVTSQIAPQFFSSVKAVNGNQFEVDQLNYRIFELSKEQGGDDATIYARAIAAKDNPQDPLYKQAQDDLANIKMIVALAKAPIPLSPFPALQPKFYSEGKQQAQDLAKGPLASTNPGDPAYQAQEALKLMRGGSPEADALNQTDALWDQTVANSPDAKKANDDFTAALQQVQAQGTTGPTATKLAEVQIMQMGEYPALQAYRLMRGQFETAFPAYAQFKQWQRDVNSQYPDLATYRDVVGRGNPAAKAFFDSAAQYAKGDTNRLDAATMSAGAYMAVNGIRASIFDPTEGLPTNTAPFTGIAPPGTGQSSSGPSLGLYGDIANYDVQRQSFDQLLGALGLQPGADQLANPEMRQAVGYKLNTLGVSPPTLPTAVNHYQQWAMRQQPGSPTDPTSYLDWQQQTMPALYGSILAPQGTTDPAQALAQYQALQSGLVDPSVVAQLMGVAPPQNLLPDMLPASVRNFSPVKTGTP